MSKNIKLLLQHIIPNLNTLTTSIYYKQLYKLVDYLDNRSWECKNFIIFCNPKIIYEVRKIAKYYKVESYISEMLPEDVLICVVNRRTIEPKINY